MSRFDDVDAEKLYYTRPQFIWEIKRLRRALEIAGEYIDFNDKIDAADYCYERAKNEQTLSEQPIPKCRGEKPVSNNNIGSIE